MSIKGVLIVLTLVTALPAVLSIFHVGEFVKNIQARLTTKNIYNFESEEIYGTKIPLLLFAGFPVLIINLPFEIDSDRVKILNELKYRYFEHHLRILAYPTDEFSPYYPYERDVSPIILKKWADDNKLDFLVFYRIHVNGENSDPLWTYLKSYFKLLNNDVTEAYTIFMVNKSGKPVERLNGNWSSVEDISNHVEQLL